jgi:hypothetical protein
MTALHPDIIRAQIAQLRLAYGELEQDDEAWLASLESETSLTELADKLIDRERECAALAGGCAQREIELAERRKRFEDQSKRIRGVLLALLQAANVRKLERPEATISIRAGGEKVEIPDDAAVPDQFCTIKKIPNKTLIKELLLNTAAKPNWAMLNRSPETLSMRVK